MKFPSMLQKNNSLPRGLTESKTSCRMVYMMMRNYSVRFAYFGVVLGLSVYAASFNSAVNKIKDRFSDQIEVIEVTVEL